MQTHLLIGESSCSNPIPRVLIESVSPVGDSGLLVRRPEATARNELDEMIAELTGRRFGTRARYFLILEFSQP